VGLPDHIDCRYCQKKIKPTHFSQRFCDSNCRIAYKYEVRLRPKILTEKECPECGLNFETYNKHKVFCCKKCYGKHYRPEPTDRSRTIDSIINVALNYDTRGSFNKNERANYEYARIHGWLDIVCEHMGDPLPNFNGGRTSFRNACIRKTGEGIFYLIKCFSSSEIFYKLGITSEKSIKDRYEGPNRMPYNYSVLLKTTGHPDEMYDLELYYKQNVKDLGLEYIPDIYFGGCLSECFQCHGNSGIIKELTS
jgi:hypothetical protein